MWLECDNNNLINTEAMSLFYIIKDNDMWKIKCCETLFETCHTFFSHESQTETQKKFTELKKILKAREL